jgi:NAD(P)-dependent dehydrogenase (short-subunit alcohol dehydrogenase family)
VLKGKGGVDDAQWRSGEHGRRAAAAKNGIITGAASGIGRATARRLAAEGAQLVLADIRPVDLALSDIRACGTEAAHCQADVSKSSDVEAMVSFAVGRFGVLDFLVNNAGIPLIKTVLDTSEEEWDRVLAVNLKSVFLACRAPFPCSAAATAPRS